MIKLIELRNYCGMVFVILQYRMLNQLKIKVMEKVYVVIEEEKIDGEVFSSISLFKHKKDAVDVFNKQIEVFKRNEMITQHYTKEDINNAMATDISFLSVSSCDDYYFEVKIEEKEIFE